MRRGALRMIFHMARPLPVDPSIGSEVHPVRMLEGFQALGADVSVVDGVSSDRARTMRAFVTTRERFDLVFSELLTIPGVLADADHVPRHPVADYAFFRAMRRRGARVGAFYPDVYWRFPEFRRELSIPKRIVAEAAHRYELVQLRSSLDLLFLPSIAMSEHVPYWEHDRIAQLPPGCAVADIGWRVHGGPLRLFYTGAVTPPLYDISAVLDAVAADGRLEITVCCPEPQRRHVDRWAHLPNVTVVHEFGDVLIERYRACDIACVAFREHPYRSFAMPVKLFEAVGVGRPVLAGGGDQVSEFVVGHGIGWAPGPGQIRQTLARLAADRSEVARRRGAVLAMRSEHTWLRRCEYVVDRLLALSGNRASS